MDKFYEQLLTTKKNIVYIFLNILMYISAIIIILSLIFSILTFNFAYFIISAIILLLLPIIRYLRDNQYKEFEYIFTNGNLQIDIIYNKKEEKQ
ncbi:hypothetical protein FDN13_13365 [Caloramator sp. E03]|uniref:hypothetical protein n=1 Tax=Caloramator sp. E03 TaxID=2576307 RepID=UPI001110ACB2|nr:hypothetical protein [Caloramator sp. E03]QCX34610.1 hypothetical protein FDN13_13365 [Caloramator sp. E03]